MIKEYIYIFLVIFFPFFMIWAFYFRGLSNLLNLTRTIETERDPYSKYQREIFCVSCNKDTLHASNWLDGFKLFLVSCLYSIIFIALYYGIFYEEPTKLEEVIFEFFLKKLIFSEHTNRFVFVFYVISILIKFAILSIVVMYIFKIIRHFSDNKICTICNPEALSYKSKWKEINKRLFYKQAIPSILTGLGVGSFFIYLFYLIMWFVFGWTLDQFLQEFLWFLY